MLLDVFGVELLSTLKCRNGTGIDCRGGIAVWFGNCWWRAEVSIPPQFESACGRGVPLIVFGDEIHSFGGLHIVD